MSEKKPCVLEGAAPGAQHEGSEHGEAGAAPHAPCALLCPVATAASPALGIPRGTPEDESADPVGDGHSDAEWAAAHPAAAPEPGMKRPASERAQG
jgi:hypothetical protein